MNKLVVSFFKISYYLLHFKNISTGGEARTPDTRFWRPVLYQLSYSRVFGCKGSVIFEIYKSIYEKYFFSIRSVILIR